MRIPPQHTVNLVLEQVTKHPELHNQDVWTCGTQRCIAGWALYFAGIPIVEGTVLKRDAPDWVIAEIGSESFHDTRGRNAFRIFDVASTVLGLSKANAKDIFYEQDEREAIRKLRRATVV